MTSIKVNLEQREYTVTVGSKIIGSANEYFNLNRKVFVLTDDGVPEEYSKTVAGLCSSAKIYTVKHGEGSKSLATLEKVLSAMMEFEMTRRDALLCVCETVNIASAVTEALKENERPLSPGMKYRHYAPKAPLTLIDGEQNDVTEFLIEKSKAENCLILAYDEEIPLLTGVKYIGVGARQDLESQAKRLFGALREADERSVDKIYAHLPVKDGIGLALYNRLIRAAAHTVITVTKKDI